MNLLHIDSSITGEASVSRKLSADIVQRLRASQPALTVVRRDLAADPLPYFSGETLAAMAGPPDPTRLDRVVLQEFLDADIVVIGAPMYNFSVPAQLKTWVDYLAIAGATFEYTAEGPRGLAGGKRVIIASSRGGLYGLGAPAAAMEHQTSYLETILGFFGVTDITTVQAEGLKVSPDFAQAAVAGAEAEIARLDLRLAA